MADKRSKRDKILEAAANLFMQQGFQSVSMDQIAASVPVSKPTLYTHFKDKRALFSAVIAVRCDVAIMSLRAGIRDDMGAEEELTYFGRQFLDLLLAKSSLQVHRVMVGESENFPEMARMFYECGPLRMHALLCDCLADLHERGALYIPDPATSADIFIGMLKGRTHMKCVLALEEGDVSEEDRNRLVDAAVSVFMHGHPRIDLQSDVEWRMPY